jgi:hypothetical protein
MDSLLNPGSQEARNVLFTVLSNHRRRYVLYACNRADGETTLSDVAEQVAAWEYDKPVEELTSAERKRVYSSIQQHHLSKLEEAGLLTVDGDRIALTDEAENLDLYVEIVPERTISWAVYYLGLATIGGFSLGFARLGWLPAPVSLPAVAGIFVGVLGVSAVVHLAQSRRMTLGSTDRPPEIDE